MVMDVLNASINMASDMELLTLHPCGSSQRYSLYANDVVVFLRPCTEDLELIKEILRVFGEASGLVTNISKCSVTPIRCHEQDITLCRHLSCARYRISIASTLDFHYQSRNSLADFYGIIDKITDKLPGSKAAMMNSAGRATLVRAVLTAIPIYKLIVLDFPKWAIKAIDKIIRTFYGKVTRRRMVAIA